MATRFIIFGIQRTGTSFLQSLLYSHRQIRCLGEMFLLSPCRFPLLSRVGAEGDGRQYREYLKADVSRAIGHASLSVRQRLIHAYLDEILDKAAFEAVGFRVMLNQCDAFPALVSYVRDNRVKVINVRRTNLLEVLVSRKIKHATNISSSTVPVSIPSINLDPVTLMPQLRRLHADSERCAGLFRSSPSIDIDYGSLCDQQQAQCLRLEAFLEVDTGPILESRLVKIAPVNVAQIIGNYPEVRARLEGTEFHEFLPE